MNEVTRKTLERDVVQLESLRLGSVERLESLEEQYTEVAQAIADLDRQIAAIRADLAR